jgi:phosphotransferase system enzyme I (PtsI)
MYAPLHPAILRVLRHVARGARRGHLPVSICGEMAADPALLPLLVGLGLREFSMTTAAIPAARQVVRGLRVPETARLASRALKAATVKDVEKVLAESLAGVKG